MGSTDSRRPLAPAHVAGCGGTLSTHGHPAARHGDGEHTASAHGPAEAADGFAANWESAWIDLGGEG